MLNTLSDLPPIQTPRLNLRRLEPEDAPEVQAISDNPTILDSIVFLPRPFTVERAEALIRAKGDGRDCFWGVWTREDGKLVGVLGSHLQGEDRMEIGYWIAPDRHGRGYASEAAGALMQLMMGMAPERRMVARAFPDNTGSINVLRKLGFRPAEEAGLKPEPFLQAVPL